MLSHFPKSSHGSNCGQDDVKHPYGDCALLDVSLSAELQGHDLLCRDYLTIIKRQTKRPGVSSGPRDQLV